MGWDGVLIVDKPEGSTSFDVVRRVRNLASGRKAGHTGTLDPIATGVLPICLGEATKLSTFLIDGDKAYEGVIRLGVETDSYDRTGRVLATHDIGHLDEATIVERLESMAGSYWQTPPMYSAVKVGGKRLYELARQGEEVERRPRKVHIETLEARGWDPEKAELRFFVRCSKGTYVRSLAHELGLALGVGGHLASLRRLQSGPFGIESAVPLHEILEWSPEEREAAKATKLIPLRDALPHLPQVRVDELRARRVLNGMRLGARDLMHARAPELVEGDRVRIVDTAGNLLAVAEQRDGALHYARVFPRKVERERVNVR